MSTARSTSASHAIAPALSLALLLAGCGGGAKVTEVSEPFEQARSRFDGGFFGQVELDDDSTIDIRGGRELDGWICGGRERLGDVCVERWRARTVHYETRDYGSPGLIESAVTVAIMWPAMAAFAIDAHESRERTAAAEAERLASEARMRAEGRTPPPPGTARDHHRESQFQSLANCMKVRDRSATNGQTLADTVWRDRDRCVSEASTWYRLNDDLERARRLSFIDRARDRYERIACGAEEHGLTAPDGEHAVLAQPGWMDEYRAVVADPQTYDYRSDWFMCRRVPPYEPIEPPAATREAALAEAMGTFPLTEHPTG